MSEARASDAVEGVVLALDLGDQRIGVAVSDRRRILASPLTIVTRKGDRARDHEEIRRLVDECGATIVVVGLPLSLSGSSGPAAKKARAEIADLEKVLPVDVVAHDERFSTVEAVRRMAETRLEHVGSRSPSKKRRVIVDDKAAAVLLESYLAATAKR